MAERQEAKVVVARGGWLTLRLEREADGVSVAEEAVDEGEPDEGDAAGDADGARPGTAGLAPRRALGVRVAARRAPPGADQQRRAQLVHLGLQALRAPQDAHASGWGWWSGSRVHGLGRRG
jgi:hypothetical protein